MRLALAKALVWICVVSAPGATFAAGFYVPDVGSRAMGRAGAFAARADDITAAWYNPAGLADLGGTRFSADLAFVKQSVFFQAQDGSGADIGYPVGNTTFPFTIPFLGLSSDFGLEKFTFALSIYGPYASKYAYPESGTQRYSLIDSSVWEAIYQVSFAWKPLKWLRVGASFQIEDVRARQKLANGVLPKSANSTPDPRTDHSGDVRAEFSVADNFVPNAHFGVLASPTPWLDLGVGLKLPVYAHTSGTLKVDPTDLARLRTSLGFTNLDVRGENVSLDLTLPLVLRAGARFHLPRFDVEADFVWEQWTGFSKLKVVPKDITYRITGNDYQALDPIEQDRGYGNAFSFRLGGDFEAIPGRLTARAGYFFESSAIPTQSLNASAVDMDKHGLTVGLTARFFGWLGVTLAYEYVHLVDTRVTDSTSQQINLGNKALGAIAGPPPAVGNGLYRSGYDILSLGLSVDIDTLTGWKRAK